MNEKEKKAIEDLKELSHYCSIRMLDLEDKNSDIWARFVVDMQIIKNLIEKQQKEIKRLKIKNNDLLRKLRNRIKDVKKLQKYGEYKKEFFTLNKRIEKQEKIINEMAEYIKYRTGSCPLDLEDCEIKFCDSECSMKIINKCWIEYFTKKVGE